MAANVPSLTYQDFMASELKTVCSACQKLIPQNIVGLHISFDWTEEKNRPAIAGALAPYALKDYNICFGCWLKSLGVKP